MELKSCQNGNLSRTSADGNGKWNQKTFESHFYRECAASMNHVSRKTTKSSSNVLLFNFALRFAPCAVFLLDEEPSAYYVSSFRGKGGKRGIELIYAPGVLVEGRVKHSNIAWSRNKWIVTEWKIFVSEKTRAINRQNMWSPFNELFRRRPFSRTRNTF